MNFVCHCMLHESVTFLHWFLDPNNRIFWKNLLHLLDYQIIKTMEPKEVELFQEFFARSRKSHQREELVSPKQISQIFSKASDTFQNETVAQHIMGQWWMDHSLTGCLVFILCVLDVNLTSVIKRQTWHIFSPFILLLNVSMLIYLFLLCVFLTFKGLINDG